MTSPGGELRPQEVVALRQLVLLFISRFVSLACLGTVILLSWAGHPVNLDQLIHCLWQFIFCVRLFLKTSLLIFIEREGRGVETYCESATPTSCPLLSLQLRHVLLMGN